MHLALIVLLPFLGAVLPALMIRESRNAAAWSAGLTSLASLALLLWQAPAVFEGGVPEVHWSWLPELGLNVSFFVDGLGFFFAALILIIGLLIILYARFYLSERDPMGQFYSYLLLFQGAMLGIVLSDNVLLLVIFWELTSLSSFLLIGYWKHLPEGRQGARMALTVTGTGGLALIAGMLLLGQAAGSYELTTILGRGAEIQASPLYLPALLLILLGAFTKSAQFPFHFWLPHAMAAPTPVSAYLHSATMVKAGVFLLARLWPVLSGTDVWFAIVAPVGLATMVIAAWIALFKDDLKALLAYSTVSHLGLIIMLLGFNSELAVVAAVFHILNHATFKAALFMSAGIVDHEAHTRDIKRLGGLVHVMPFVSTLAIIAGASMGGLAPLNGFLSKEMMLEEAAHTVLFSQDWLVPVMATLGALFSAAYSARWVFAVFLGPERHDYPHHPHDPPFGMSAAPFLLVILVVLIGLFPAALAEPVVSLVSNAVAGRTIGGYHLALWHGFTPALFMSAIALAGGIALYLLYRPANAVRLAVPRPEAKRLFDQTVAGAVAASRAISDRLHDSSLPSMLCWTLVTLLALGLYGFFSGEFTAGDRPMMEPSGVAVVAWILLAVATGAIVLQHRRRLLALILVGVCGLVVSLTFFYFSAPDLALTQISVEVVTTILMMLALNYLPKETPPESWSFGKVRDAVLAVVAGLGAAVLVFLVMTRGYDTIAAYHLAESKPQGGGTNVVNVILVDFRGYDTYGEITVLGIAAIIISALLGSRLRGGAVDRLRSIAYQPLTGERHPLILAVMTRILLPLALMVGVYIFLRGHNEPGGGFIAGLVIGVALLMQYMASGHAWADQRIKVDYHPMIAVGLLTAGLTGVGAFLNDAPFMTSDFGYVHLPWIGEFEVATAALFDLGVFLTVVGMVMLALATLSRIARLVEGEHERFQPYDLPLSAHELGETTTMQES